MPLTNTGIRNFKRARSLFAGRPTNADCTWEVSPAGGKWWRLISSSGNKEKRLSLGVYPDVGLKDARNRREEARKLWPMASIRAKIVKRKKTAQADTGIEQL